MTKSKILFVGNRRFVLRQILRMGFDVTGLIVVSGSHLERDLNAGLISWTRDFHVIHSRAALIDLIPSFEFDLLIANGCPYILPITQLPSARYINVHPSFLPDLRGADPVIGSILYKRDSGATCHIMDNGIDSGSIISQVRIPYSDDLDVSTLYQLSFIAEEQAFCKAAAVGFKATIENEASDSCIYYSRSPSCRMINFKEQNDDLLQKVKAFSNKSQGCIFKVNQNEFRFYNADRLHNPFLAETMSKVQDGVVIFNYENNLVFRKDDEFLRFIGVSSVDGITLTVGDRLFVPK